MVCPPVREVLKVLKVIILPKNEATMTNSVDPDQTASGSTMFARTC